MRASSRVLVYLLAFDRMGSNIAGLEAAGDLPHDINIA